jgi:DNA-directed RNA polymerase subunit RPC12/RpoP
VKALRAFELCEKYARCHECGSDLLGNGEGTLKITDDTFIRTCKCGWKVEIKEVTHEQNRRD